MSKLYDKNSIESLSPLEFTRLKPGVYAGDTTYSTQLLVEILSNAIDEYRLGHGKRIDITIIGDVITVQDYGQGFIPNEFREDGKSILEAAFSVLNTSGKYREDGTYEGTSLGSFGIGSKITTFLSHWLFVETHRDNKYEALTFEEGVFDKIFTTNLIYQKEEMLSKEYYFSINMERYIAAIIDTMNNGDSMSKLTKPAHKIKETVEKYKKMIFNYILFQK